MYLCKSCSRAVEKSVVCPIGRDIRIRMSNVSTMGCLKYSSTASARREDTLIPWKDCWCLGGEEGRGGEEGGVEESRGQKERREQYDSVFSVYYTPEVCLPHLLHVECFVCEGGNIQNTLCWVHLTCWGRVASDGCKVRTGRKYSPPGFNHFFAWR